MKNICSEKYIYFLILYFLLHLPCFSECFAQDKDQAGCIELSFRNDGSNVSGKLYKAEAAKPAPAVILLQGYPGRDSEYFGIGTFLKNNGINAYVFNYRGSFQSEGFFSIENSVADVIKAVEFLKLPDVSKKYNIDTTNLTILGYSLGSEIAFLGSKSCPSVKKLIALGCSNLKLTADKIEADSAYRRNHMQAIKLGLKFMHSNMNAEQLHAWLLSHKSELDLANCIDALSGKQILFIGGVNDLMAPVEENTIPLYRLFQEKENSRCSMKLLECGHNFKDVQPELHRIILDWVKN